MQPPGNNTRPIIFGFILVIGITLTPTSLLVPPALSAARGDSRLPGFDRQDFFSHRFDRFGFIDGGRGFSEVITIQQSQPTPNIEPSEPDNRVYVQPRWVDGGYGVEVLQPGYWTDPKQPEKR
jgi:hypothetical protein